MVAVDTIQIDRLEIYFGYKINKTWWWVYVYGEGALLENDLREREKSKKSLGLWAHMSECMLLTRKEDIGNN